MRALSRVLRPFEVKSVDDVGRSFEGLAATWDLDLGGDVIHRGAFAKSLSWWKSTGESIPLCDQHRKGSIHDVLGSVVEAEEREEGLWARFEVDEGEDGQKLLRHIKAKRLNGLSIGYEAVAPERDERGIRHLREVRLFEVSAVLWPMNPGAVFDPASVKSLVGDLNDEAMQELRDALDAEAKARALAADPQLSTEQMDALRSRLLTTRLRPLLSRTSGQNAQNTPTMENAA